MGKGLNRLIDEVLRGYKLWVFGRLSLSWDSGCCV
jgi:hypothetical protein